MSSKQYRRVRFGRSLLATAAVVLTLVSSATAAAGDGGLPAGEATVPGGDLMVAGYLILWVMLGGYLFFVMWRQRRLGDEIEELEQRIDQAFDAVGEEPKGRA